MDWKKLLEFLKDNVRMVDYCYIVGDVEIVVFTFRGITYSIWINTGDSKLSISKKGDFEYIYSVSLTRKELSQSNILYEEIKEAFNIYHRNLIAGFITLESKKPTSIEELNDDDEE